MPSLRLNHPAAENSSEQFLYDDTSTGYESDRITTVRSSLSSVTSTYSGCGRTIFRALVTDFGSIANTIGRQPIWKRNLFGSDHPSLRSYRNVLEIMSYRLSDFEYDTGQITSPTSGD